jgi:hypothetical protein
MHRAFCSLWLKKKGNYHDKGDVKFGCQTSHKVKMKRSYKSEEATEVPEEATNERKQLYLDNPDASDALIW